MQRSRSSITAAEALINAGVDPATVERRLPNVSPSRVRIVPASRLMRRFWAKGISAVCMPWAIYVTPALYDRLRLGDRPTAQAQLVVHELVHLQQYRTAGPLRHLVRYVRDYVAGRRHGLGHWDAYLEIGAEQEARTIAAEFRETAGPR